MALDAGKKVHSGEAGITFVSVAYFFFVICSYYVIKPIRGSLALELGSDNIPVLNILSMVSLVVANAVYSWIVGRYQRDIFIPFITRFFVVCLAIFWIMFSFIIPVNEATTISRVDRAQEEVTQSQAEKAPNAAEESETQAKKDLPASSMSQELVSVADGEISLIRTLFIGAYYLWVNFFALMAVSMFWSFMNDVFSVSQGRRLYAIIGYGGLLGGLAGSALTTLLVQKIGTYNLLLVAIVLLYPSIWCMRYIHNNHYRPENIVDENNQPASPAHPPRPWDGFLSVCKNPILICMALEMFLYTFSSTMFFQQLNRLIELEIGSDVDNKTRFIAGMYGRINIVSLFAQFIVTRLMMMLPNPIYGLLSLTLIQVVGSCLTLFNPSLTVVSWIIIIRYALDYSTGRALRELVYIPLGREAKYQGKGFIDTVVFRVGDGLSSIMLIGGLHFFYYGSWIDFSIQVSMLIQFYVIIKTAGMYASRLKTAETAETAPVPAS